MGKVRLINYRVNQLMEIGKMQEISFFKQRNVL